MQSLPLQIVFMVYARKLQGKMRNPDITPPTLPARRPIFLPTQETKTLRATWRGHDSCLLLCPSSLADYALYLTRCVQKDARRYFS